jgi:rhodanese-related sulfurtransferase
MKRRLGSKIGLSKRGGASGADVLLSDGDAVEIGSVKLSVLETPGHTDGCVTYVTADRSAAFTGDALLIRGAGRTDFQQGDARVLFRSIKEKILALPDGCTLYPGHDYQGRTVTTVGEEKAHNPRCGGDANESDFVGYMSNLALPHPKQIDVAVPANLRCGEPSTADLVPAQPAWGPVVRSYAGVPEIDPAWVAEHRATLTLLDVREPAELEGELGHVAGALAIPLGALRERVGDVPQERPVVVVCRSGRRSAQACAILEKAGFPAVANVMGGMIRWRALGLPAARP